MDRRTFVKTLPAITLLAGTTSISAPDLNPIILPEPEKDGGISVLAALQERRTNRSISTEKLPLQVLSCRFPNITLAILPMIVIF